MAKTTQFASKIGLIAATVGSAVGLGNVWRFPAETQANGGAAFLIIYIACVFLLGVPVMVAEFAIGRSGRSDAVGSFINLGASRPWWAVGGVAILASYMILCFYMVVAGWTLEYLIASVSGFLYDGAGAMAHTDSAFFAGKMSTLIGSRYYPLIATYVVILINAAVLIVGVQKGIERMSNIMMPLLFVILLVLCGVSLTLPGASEGLEFFLRPDFSRVTASTFLNALGQAFFSLSLGMGILITYASYFPRTTHLTRTAVTVSMLDLLVALLMGFIIFPAVTTVSLEGESLSGSTLVFVTLPEVFARMPATQVWSVMFFLLLFVAALTSTISIAEVSVAFVADRMDVPRRVSTIVVLLPLFGFSTVCALSQLPSLGLTIGGATVFDFLDDVATNMLLPLVAMFTCLYVGWFAPPGLLRREVTNRGSARARAHGLILFILRYVAPLLTGIILVSRFL